MAKKKGPVVALAPYAHWLECLRAVQGGRPGYKDQTEESLSVLVGLVGRYNIKSVLEIGTSYGASTRAWLHAGVRHVTCVDLTFNPFRLSWSVLPVDQDKLTLIEQSVGGLPLWEKMKGTPGPHLIYFDCHGADNMRYVLGQFQQFPPGTVFAVDDMWYSPDRLDEWWSQQFCERVVTKDIDTALPKSLWPQSWANYWAGGAFYSFDEVVPLLAYVNGQSIRLQMAAKEVWWQKA